MIEKLAIKNDRALGIHISESRISFALVKHELREIRLVKAGHIAVPPNAIENGSIKDPALLGKALKTLLDKSHVRNRQACISLFARPVIAQIIDLPKYIPSNMAKFVQSEIRHSAALSGKEAQYDFCGLTATSQAMPERIFVAAANKDKINTMLKTCIAAKVEPVSIELPTIGALRALYKKRITIGPERKLVVGIQRSMISFAVLSHGNLELIRNIDISSLAEDETRFLDRCCSEMEVLFQFYELEVEQGSNAGWQVLFQTETRSLNLQALQERWKDRPNVQVSLCSDQTIYDDIPIKKAKSIDNASTTAIGLALRMIESSSLGIEINLLPPEAKEISTAKKYCLVTANIAAVVLLTMFIIGGMVRVKLSATENDLQTIKTANQSENIDHMVARQRTLTQRIERLENQKKNMGEFYDDGNIVMWTDLLDEIRRKTPKSLCIINLGSTDNENLSISGYGLSYKAIHLFADLLRESPYIETVNVAETNKMNQFEGYVTYQLECILKTPHTAESSQKEDKKNAS